MHNNGLLRSLDEACHTSGSQHGKPRPGATNTPIFSPIPGTFVGTAAGHGGIRKMRPYAYPAALFRHAVCSLRPVAALFVIVGIVSCAFVHAQTAAHFSGAQLGLGSGLSRPWGVAVDGSGNVYIADSYNGRVLKETLSAGSYTQSTVASSGLVNPLGVAVDGSGNVYIVDATAGVFKETVSGSTYTQSTVTTSSLNNPSGLAVDSSGNVYIADTTNQRVLKETLSGSTYSEGTIGSSLQSPCGIAVDSSGNVYIGDSAAGVLEEMWSGSSYTQQTIASSGLNLPCGVAVDSSGNVYVADTGNHRMVEEAVSGGSYTPQTVATSGLQSPYGVAVDASGNIYIGDYGNNAVDEISMSGANFGLVNVRSPSSAVTLLFTFDSGGAIEVPAVLTMGTPGLDYADAGTGTCTTNGATYDYNAGDICTVNVIFTPAYPGTEFGTVELLNGSSTILTTAYISGTGVGPLAGFSPGAVSVLNVSGLTLNASRRPVFDAQGNLYVADDLNNRIVKIAPGGAGTVVVPNVGTPTNVAMDGAGNLYVVSNDNSIQEYTSAGTFIKTLNNNGLSYYNVTVAVDGSGNVYTNDAGPGYSTNNARIIWFPKGGPAEVLPFTGWSFTNPWAVAVDGAGNLYVGDHTSNALVKITNGIASQVNTGPVTFWEPLALALDSAGNIYVDDYDNSRIVELPSGSTNTPVVLSMGTYTLSTPVGDAVSRTGELYIMDTGHNRILVSSQETAPTLGFGSVNVGSTSSAQTVTLMNLGNGPLIFSVPESGTNPSMSSNFVLNNSTCPTVNSTDEPASLPANSSCGYQIAFAPRQLGPITSAFTLTDNASNGAVQSISLTGTGTGSAPTITVSPTTATLAGGTVGTAYTPLTFTVIGGTSPYSYALMIPGSLPTGLTLSSTGMLSGTPTAAGTFPFTVIATDANSYTGSQAYSLTISQGTPSISTWPTSTAISYGQTLASSTLSGGSGSVGGSFAFTTATTAPGVGTAAQSVTFTPTDSTDYSSVTGSVNVTVNKATPSVSTWPTATAISYGQTLASSTLSGGSVGGNFAFTTPTTAPGAGTAAQSVTFTPADSTDYSSVTGSVNVTVNKATPSVSTWPTAAAISYGQTLASSTLSGGSGSVGGSFAFTTATTAPGVGTAAQSVTFTPTDSTDYSSVTGSVNVTVNKATPSVSTWPTAAAISYGQTLASSTLSGGAGSVGGSFAFTTPTTAPGVGTAAQSVAFTPADTTDYTTVVGSVQVTVNSAGGGGTSPTITSLSPALIESGSAAFTLTVNGSNFASGATVLWNGSSRTTTFVSANQLTASIAAEDIATVGMANVTVANSSNGGTSSNFVFAIDTAAGMPGDFTVSSTTTVPNVGRGQTTQVPVTLTGVASGSTVVASCANLPAGAACTYNNGVVTISTSANTPPGSYTVTVIFQVTQQTTAMIHRRPVYLAAWLGLSGMPLGWVWIGGKRKRVVRRCLVLLVGLLLMLSLAGCGGRSTPATGTTTHISTQTSTEITLSIS